jgi:two-component system, cell cycle sensor histidine kinase and response regulator CckA
MSQNTGVPEKPTFREKFLGLSLESSRKSYYPQLMAQLEAVQQNERRLRLLMDNLPARISYVDADERYVLINHEYEKALELERGKVIGQRMRDVLGRRNYTIVEAHVHEALTGRQVRFEVRLELKRGGARWLEINFVPDIDAKGAVIGFYDLTHDFTDRKRAEASLRQSEEQYRLLVQNASDAIFVFQDDRIKFPNPKTMEILGVGDPVTETLFLMDFIHPDDREPVSGMYRRGLSDQGDQPLTCSFKVINTQNREYTVHLNAVRIQWHGRPATLNFVRDITQQKKMEAELRQAQKMEAIGTLAGGIAHDFNNILMGIQGRASLMLAEIDTAHPYHEHLAGIQTYIKSATDLTKQLLGFARGGKYEAKPTDMNELLDQSVEMFGRTKKEIRIVKNFASDLWPVEVDRGQINQVLLNLFVNAWQAMPGGGELFLRTHNQELRNNGAAPVRMDNRGRIKIDITDTGVGMDEATLSRIFDPFFTTRTMGRGTGLGLASSYGIIRNHGGDIQVRSEPGRGSTFSIFLPATRKKVVAAVKAPETKPVKGKGQVLLVDDEEMILQVGRQMLTKLGYAVLTAGSGEEAINVFNDLHAGIDLVILDMIMPGIAGGETFDRLKGINPNCKVLLSSGYSLNGQAAEILERGCAGFMQKPFSLSELSRKIEEIISG